MKNQSAFIISVILALACAGVLSKLLDGQMLPVLGPLPLTPAVLIMGVIGFGAIWLLEARGVAPSDPPPVSPRSVGVLLLVGFVLSIPPVLIDLAIHFPQGMNLPMPEALVFYPAIALVAEVQFHLLPLVLVSYVLPRDVPLTRLVLPVILFYSLGQVAFLQGFSLQAILVLFNVGLISAVQMWAFLRHGFAGMLGVRLAFYLFWHIVWGTLRLDLLF